MPEFPDVTVYIEALSERVLNQPIQKNPHRQPVCSALLRSAHQRRGGKESLSASPARQTHRLRAGRRTFSHRSSHDRRAVSLETERREDRPQIRTGRVRFSQWHAALDRSRNQEARVDSPGIAEKPPCKNMIPAVWKSSTRPLSNSAKRSRAKITRLKRSLTDPHLFSGIGNAYSDEILHRARLSPIRLTQQMTAGEIETLYHAIRESLNDWVERLRKERGRASRKKSRPSAPTWPSTANTASLVRSAALPFSASFTPRTKPTTARSARPAESYWPTDRCRGFSKQDWPRTLEELEEGYRLRTE